MVGSNLNLADRCLAISAVIIAGCTVWACWTGYRVYGPRDSAKIDVVEVTLRGGRQCAVLMDAVVHRSLALDCDWAEPATDAQPASAETIAYVR